jgi:hypothetical protein
VSIDARITPLVTATIGGEARTSSAQLVPILLTGNSSATGLPPDIVPLAYSFTPQIRLLAANTVMFSMTLIGKCAQLNAQKITASPGCH